MATESHRGHRHLLSLQARFAVVILATALVNSVIGCGPKPDSGTAQVVSFNYSQSQLAQAKQAQADLDLLKPMTIPQRQAYVSQHPDVAQAIEHSPSQLQKLQLNALLAGKM